MKKLWEDYGLLIQIATIIFMAGSVYASVTYSKAQIEDLQRKYESIPSALARIEQKVDDIKEDVNRLYRGHK